MKGQYGIGAWGVMGLGAWGPHAGVRLADLFRFPTRFEAASLVRTGWANAHLFTRTARRVWLRPVETSSDVALVPLGRYQHESFFLEYRSNRGFSSQLAGHGLLIWKGWEIIQADGRDDLNHGRALGRRPLPPNGENFGDASDPFPGDLGVTSYEDPATGLRFENIAQTDELIELDIVFPGPELEAASDRAVTPSLRTYSKSFRPASINGQPWPVDDTP